MHFSAKFSLLLKVLLDKPQTFQYNIDRGDNMIYREHYIQPVREFYDSDLIKIITGIRRSGKSVILQQIMADIGQKTDNIISLNFEDKRVSANITDGNVLKT